MYKLRDRSVQSWAMLERDARPVTKLAVFVHGYRGGYLSTWGNLADLIEKNAHKAEPFSAWDYLFLGYSSQGISTYLDIAGVVRNELHRAESAAAPFKNKYQSFALFGHSLGTLGVRQLLCLLALDRPQTISHVHSITLFGPPMNGSWLAKFGIARVAEALRPNNGQLLMLKEWSRAAYSYKKWPQPRLVVGTADWVVGVRDSWLVDWEGDAKPTEYTSFGHVNMVKPCAWDSRFIELVKEALE